MKLIINFVPPLYLTENAFACRNRCKRNATFNWRNSRFWAEGEKIKKKTKTYLDFTDSIPRCFTVTHHYNLSVIWMRRAITSIIIRISLRTIEEIWVRNMDTNDLISIRTWNWLNRWWKTRPLWRSELEWKSEMCVVLVIGGAKKNKKEVRRRFLRCFFLVRFSTECS